MQTQIKGYEFTFFHANFTTTIYDQNLHNYLILAWSRDAIEHDFLMTTWYPLTICYRCSIVTESVSPAVARYWALNILRLQHTLRHWSRDDSIPHMPFLIGVPSKPRPYLQALESYSTPNIFGSRPWPFMALRFSICSFLLVLHWKQVAISSSFRDIWLQMYRGHDLDLLGSRNVIGHVTIWCPI